MSFLTILSETSHPLVLIFAVASIFGCIFIFVALWANRYTKVGPDEVLVVSGRRRVCTDPDGKTREVGFRMVKGGGTFVFPVIEQAKVLSLKPISLDLALPKIPTQNGGSVELLGKAQVKIKSDDLSLAKAAECLLGKSPDELKEIAGQIMENSVRSIIGRRTAADISQTQSSLATQLQEAAKPELAGLGLEILSLSIRDLRVSG